MCTYVGIHAYIIMYIRGISARWSSESNTAVGRSRETPHRTLTNAYRSTYLCLEKSHRIISPLA